MNNNDVLRNLRYIFDFNDAKMIELFGYAELVVTRSQISDWLKGEEDPDLKQLYDQELAFFLNGLIVDRRGKKDGVVPPAEKKLNNNSVFRKIKIALSLTDDDLIEIFALKDFKISKHELSAFFRNPSQPQYRVCKDQILRNFLQGLRVKYRGN